MLIPKSLFPIAISAAGAALAFGWSGCSKAKHPDGPVAMEQQSGPRIYQAKGILRSMDKVKKKLVITNEDIPGFMEPMTMPYRYDGPAAALDSLKADGGLRFSVVVSESDYWITGVEAIPASEVSIPAGDQKSGDAGMKPAPSAKPLAIGERVPEFSLTDENGATISQKTFEGKWLLVTFFYTSCPIPTFCPLMSKNFEALQAKVATDPALKGKAALLSISFDPKDTPQVLKKYGEFYHETPGVWSFATGSREQLVKLEQNFSVVVQNEGSTITHSLTTVLIDPNGAVKKLWKGNGWEVEDVFDVIKKNASR